jgi:hypothetical protein
MSLVRDVSNTVAMQSSIFYRSSKASTSHLHLGEQASRLTLEIEEIDQTMPLTSATQAEKWKNHAVKPIKRFAHSKKSVEVQADVERHFRIGG